MKVTWSINSFHFRLARALANLPVTWVADPKTPEEIERAERGDTYGITKKPVYYGDFCSYVPYVIESMLKLIALLFMAVVLMVPVVTYLSYLAACLTTWSDIEIDIVARLGRGLLVLALTIVVGFFALMFAHYKWDEYQEWRESRPQKQQDIPKPKKEPGFITQLFRKIKQKTCIRIEII